MDASREAYVRRAWVGLSRVPSAPRFDETDEADERFQAMCKRGGCARMARLRTTHGYRVAKGEARAMQPAKDRAVILKRYARCTRKKAPYLLD